MFTVLKEDAQYNLRIKTMIQICKLHMKFMTSGVEDIISPMPIPIYVSCRYYASLAD